MFINRKISKIIVSMFIVLSVCMINIVSNAAQKYDGWSIDKLSGYIKSNLNTVYNTDAESIVGSTLKAPAHFGYQYSYCLDQHTGRDPGFGSSGTYTIANVLDVDENANVKVYDLAKYSVDKNKKKTVDVDVYDITSKEGKKYAYTMTYITYNGRDETSIVPSAGKGKHKMTFQEFFWAYINELHKYVHINSKFKATTSYTKNRGGSIGKIMNEALKQAEKLANIALEDKTQKDIQVIETVGNKTYVGPYKVAFTGTKLTQAEVNEIKTTKYATKVGGDEKEFTKLKSGNEFYIVLDKEIEKAETVKVYTEKETVYKGRIMFIKGNGCQDFDAYVPLPPEYKQLELELLKVEKQDGSLTIKKTVKDSEELLGGVGFKLKHQDKGYVKVDETGAITYIKSKKKATEFFTATEGEQKGYVTINGLAVGNYNIYETSNPNFGFDISAQDGVEVVKIVSGTNNKTIENEKTTGNLKAVKVDSENHEIKLANVKFKIQNEETGLWVNQASDGTINLLSEAQATEFKTDEKGKLEVNGLLVGKYKVYEVENPNKGYTFDNNGVTVVIEKGNNEEVFENTQKYINLSGYVWIDKPDQSKGTYRDDHYTEDGYDNINVDADGNKSKMDLSNITVNLKEGNTVVKTTKTDANGVYKFTEVEIGKLANYYIEFEYNGLTYTSINKANVDLNSANGSKAAEAETTRTTFNQTFNSVENNLAKDTEGNKTYDLSYTLNERLATLNGREDLTKFTTTSNTNEAGYSIKSVYDEMKKILTDTEEATSSKVAIEEISNINLGLYEREQPEILVVNDIDNVDVLINGHRHVYNYGDRIKNKGNYESGFNVGVKFGNKYKEQSYTRAIYKSDYEWVGNPTNELQVWVTYKILIRNASTSLNVKVNSIVDYFDSRYTLDDENVKINNVGNIATNNSKYNKIEIDTSDTIIAPGNEKEVSIRFKLNREAVAGILGDTDTKGRATSLLYNVAEIKSYSIYDNKGVYAGIDKYSNPEDADPDDINTQELDTDRAPGLQLEVANARAVDGTVFYDKSTSENTQIAQTRQGDGQLNNGEEGIENVTVTLMDNDTQTVAQRYDEEAKQWVEAVTNTNRDGYFEIKGFKPGNYKVIYTWGNQQLSDGTVLTVENYKGTTYGENRRSNYASAQNTSWYKGKDFNDPALRYSDAIDDYSARVNIDNNTLVATPFDKYNSELRMNASTPVMAISVEYSGQDVFGTSNGDKFEHRISNVDFGITERARQEIQLDKYVSAIKVTSAAGQVLSDAKIDEEGNITGERKVITNRPTVNGISGFVQAELDNELMQGATIEVEYTLKATNIGEKDYLSEDYYNFGIQRGNEATISATEIVDYLDYSWVFETSTNPDWSYVENTEDLQDKVKTDVINDAESQIKDRKILTTSKLSGEQLKPNESKTVTLKVSKIIAPTDEDLILGNEAEIIKATKTIGTMIKPETEILGNYIPGKNGQKDEKDDAKAESVLVHPNTGENRSYTVPIAVGLVAIIILGAGVFVIKKKVVDDK